MYIAIPAERRRSACVYTDQQGKGRSPAGTGKRERLVCAFGQVGNKLVVGEMV